MLTEVLKQLQSDIPKKWVFIGDSLTHAPYSTHGYRDYTEIFKEFLTYDYDRRTDIVINTAIGGDTTRDILQGFKWRVADLNPDVVFVMIGMNDCSTRIDISLDEFDDNLNTICQRIFKLKAIPILQTTCPIIECGAKDRIDTFKLYMETVRGVSQKLKIALIDHAEYWHKYELSHINMMNDFIHPNQYGHRLFAKLILEKLKMDNCESDVISRYIPKNIKYKEILNNKPKKKE